MIHIDANPFVPQYALDPRMGKEITAQDSAKQLAWIEKTLSGSDAPWKIVFGHHPIYSGGEHGDTRALIDRLLPVLSHHGVQAYICGHDHDLQHLQAGSLNLFCTGAGSTVRDAGMTPNSKFVKPHPGFLAASLKPDGMDVRLIAGTGEVLYTFRVPQRIG
jgi:acid phosphatase